MEFFSLQTHLSALVKTHRVPCVSFPSPLEMVVEIKRVACMEQDLSTEERNLLSVAYKNVIGARRASWRIISSLEQKEEGKSTDASADKLQTIRNYRTTVRLSARLFSPDSQCEQSPPPPSDSKEKLTVLLQIELSKMKSCVRVCVCVSSENALVQEAAVVKRNKLSLIIIGTAPDAVRNVWHGQLTSVPIGDPAGVPLCPLPAHG